MQEIKSFFDEESEKNGELVHHLKLKKGDVGRYVLLPGDPKRCGEIAKHLTSPKLMADFREYVTISGIYKGIPVSIVSTGMGCPSAVIALEELVMIGADTFIRVGTAGGLSLNVHPGDLTIGQAAIRDEGTSYEYIPREYPAVAHPQVVSALVKSAHTQKYPYHVGVVHSKDSFYGEVEPQNALFREKFEKNLDIYTKLGALSSEMESAGLFSAGSLRKVRVGSIMLSVENTMIKRLGGKQEPTFDLERLILTSLEAICILAEEDKSGGII